MADAALLGGNTRRPRPPIATDQQLAERIAWSQRELQHTAIHREAFDTALR